MRLSSLSFAIFVSLISGPALAGFEWLPPQQNPQPITHSQTLLQPNILPAISAPVVRPVPMVGTPAMPSVVPPSGFSTQQVPQVRGLVIDPYPLRNSTNKFSVSNVNKVEQAMMEQSRILNPVPLGVGAQTSTQARAIIPFAVPPPAPSTKQAYSRGISAPVPKVPTATQAGLTPLIGGEVAPLYDIEQEYRQPVQPPLPIVNSSIAPENATPIRKYTDAVGFGRNLPLAMALSQVIPSEFSYSYLGEINPAEPVSWEGGLPWNQVLDQMLKERNLAASIQGNKVVIRSL